VLVFFCFLVLVAPSVEMRSKVFFVLYGYEESICECFFYFFCFLSNFLPFKCV
jgi:hypothetical protein